MKLKCRESGVELKQDGMGAVGFKVISVNGKHTHGPLIEIEFYSLRNGVALGRTAWVKPEDIDCEVDDR